MDLILRNDLLAIRAKIDTPEKWTQECYARGEAGEDVRPLSKTACRFCAMGAMISLQLPRSRHINVVQYLQEKIPKPHNITSYNDTRTHAEVMALFKELDV